jgi:hypothetical protein
MVSVDIKVTMNHKRLPLLPMKDMIDIEGGNPSQHDTRKVYMTSNGRYARINLPKRNDI